MKFTPGGVRCLSSNPVALVMSLTLSRGHQGMLSVLTKTKKCVLMAKEGQESVKLEREVSGYLGVI